MNKYFNLNFSSEAELNGNLNINEFNNEKEQVAESNLKSSDDHVLLSAYYKELSEKQHQIDFDLIVFIVKNILHTTPDGKFFLISKILDIETVKFIYCLKVQ